MSGLVAGFALPWLAAPMRPVLPWLVVALIFLAVVRMSPGALRAALPALPRAGLAVALLQVGLPLSVIGGAALLGQAAHPVALALTLMCAAPAIMGAPNITMMLGQPPDAALRLTVLGTALVPLTILPIFALSPQLAEAGAVRETALRLMVTIFLTSAAALALRRVALKAPSERTEKRLEGLSSILLAVFVIGLMPQVSVVALTDPGALFYWAGIAFAANFGAQVVAFRLTGAVGLSIIAGNRNVALFLVSLPPETTAPILVFIGCYQLPMYLTPLLMRRLYRP